MRHAVAIAVGILAVLPLPIAANVWGGDSWGDILFWMLIGLVYGLCVARPYRRFLRWLLGSGGRSGAVQ
jgi:hypothetical protein